MDICRPSQVLYTTQSASHEAAGAGASKRQAEVVASRRAPARVPYAQGEGRRYRGLSDVASVEVANEKEYAETAQEEGCEIGATEYGVKMAKEDADVERAHEQESQLAPTRQGAARVYGEGAQAACGSKPGVAWVASFCLSASCPSCATACSHSSCCRPKACCRQCSAHPPQS